MHILHYSLGLPPFRRGGMTKYCDDLMVEQKKMGNHVSLLYPGTLKNCSSYCSLAVRKAFILNGVELDELIEIKNPLPVPLVDGIKDIDLFTMPKDISVFNKFFDQHHFEVLHIHTLMGLPLEVIISAKLHGIKVIFTTHDYFPICPRVFLFHDGKNCDDDNGCRDCVSCNTNALSFRKMKLLQSKGYQTIKNTYFVKKIRGAHNKKMYLNDQQVVDMKERGSTNELLPELPTHYVEYRQRNIDLLNSLDKVHFNSSNTLKVYEKYGKTLDNSIVISISSNSIDNHKKIVSVDQVVRLGYLGPAVMHKGMGLLISTCDDLWEEGNRNFQLHLYVNEKVEREYIINHGPYEYSDLDKVMSQFELLVVPSIWDETFGFTILEAHSYGIPAIVSERVGAKDIIIDKENGNVFRPTVDELKLLIQMLLDNPKIVESYSRWIFDNEKIKTMYDHAGELLELYNDLCNG